MNIKKVNIAFNIFIICLFSLLIISTVSASDDINSTYNSHYYVTSDISNNDMQSMLDNANNNDVFEFTSVNYNNISLIIDKQLKIISNKNSTINVATSPSDKAVNLGITNTFGFYFTKNSSGSLLSGFNIIAPSCDYAIILNASSDTIIENNSISKANNNILVKNTSNVQINNNYIHDAIVNGIQVQDITNISILNNTISYNGRSGIETSNIFSSNIWWNEIYFNFFNGISMYNQSSNNNITYNHVYENTNGIYINSQSNGEKFLYNTLEFNRMDPNSELGGFETGNGLLFGEDYETVKKQKPDISYNALMHNENFQAKNNPTKDPFKLGANYFDSNDDVHTFICPMLLAKILTMDFSSVSNGIGIQIYEDGEPVNDFAFFDQKVVIDGKEYSAKIENGKGLIEVDSSQNHVVEVQHGEKVPDYRKIDVDKYTSSSDNDGSSSGGSSNNQGSGSGQGDSIGSGSGSGTSNDTTDSNDGNGGSASNWGNDDSNAISNSTGVISNNQGTVVANYGDNSSDISSQSFSVVGQEQQSQGKENAADSGNVESGDSSSPSDSEDASNAYELFSVSKKSNPLQDNSVIIVIAILLLVVLFVYGYRRKNEFE